jgi:hypothetical protein
MKKNLDSEKKEKIIEKKEENGKKDYTLKVCPTELYGDKLIKILEDEFEKENKKNG